LFIVSIVFLIILI